MRETDWLEIMRHRIFCGFRGCLRSSAQSVLLVRFVPEAEDPFASAIYQAESLAHAASGVYRDPGVGPTQTESVQSLNSKTGLKSGLKLDFEARFRGLRQRGHQSASVRAVLHLSEVNQFLHMGARLPRLLGRACESFSLIHEKWNQKLLLRAYLEPVFFRMH